ncbi:MAG: toprim domain-containing protein [Loktanella sp.]|nr:toprim domain-containing protein [Loktanella sp.]
MFHQKTTQAAKGNWKGILMALGMQESFLTGKHGPCPLCGGKDRFRWDNRDGRGTYICNQCGAGDGMALARAFTGKPFVVVASQIDSSLGNVKPDGPSRHVSSQDYNHAALKALYLQSQPVNPGDVVDRYFASRDLNEIIYPKALRYVENLRDGEGGVHPCMIALVGRYGEKKFDTIHRTFLKPDGSGKAEIQSPRKLMPGQVPDGACVMLSDWTESGPLGIAEGIETAMAASAIFNIPVWAAINSSMMKKWLPPPGCQEIVIFGDNDKKYGGQAAAYHLAQRLSALNLPVGQVLIPQLPGEDWADEWVGKSTRR